MEGGSSGRKLTDEEQADAGYFGDECWSDGDVIIPPAAWSLLLSLVYSGQVDQSILALESIWPGGKPGQAAFAQALLEAVRGSWYGSRLPWFDELEAAFERRYHVSRLPASAASSP